jgi:hypothetical protein
VVLALRSELLARLAVQTLGIGLVGAGLGDRLLVGSACGSRWWILRQSGTGSDCERKKIAAMTVDFVIIRFLPPCEIRAGVEFIMVVLDWRHASSTFARNETQRRLERYLFQRPRPERCAPIPQNTPSRSKEPQAEATTCNPEYRLRGVSFWGGIRPIRDRDHFHKVELAF